MQAVWARVEQPERLVTIDNSRPGDRVRLAKGCASLAMLADLDGREGTLVRRDRDLEAW